MNLRRFLHNDHARIPFSVIGVFLLLGSSMTTVYVSQLEEHSSWVIAQSLDINKVDRVRMLAEADINRGLSYAGLEAMEYLGKHPVTFADLSALGDAAQDYADNDGDGMVDISMTGGEPTMIDTEEEAIAYTTNWAKNMIRVHFNEYLLTNFFDDRFVHNGYTVNVVLNQDDGVPLVDWRRITVDELSMDIQRHTEGLNGLVAEYGHTEDDRVWYPTYWQVSVPVQVMITDMQSGMSEHLWLYSTCLIPSRLPLLMALMYTYEDTLNGVEDSGDLLSNKLQVLTTLISQVYTEARALVQWASGPGRISNIVDNTWLKYVSNAAVTTEQFLVFNSVDPLCLLQLILQCKDIAGDDSSMDQLMGQQGSSVLFDINIREDMVNYLVQQGFEQDDAQDMLDHPSEYMSPEMMTQASIGNLAEDLLYEVTYTYYYHNQDDPSDVVSKDQAFYDAEGCSFEHQGHTYLLGDLQDVDDYTDDIIFDRAVDYTRINDEVIQAIDSELQQVYQSLFSTETKREIHSSVVPSWYHPGPYDVLQHSSGWFLQEVTPKGSVLNPGELLEAMVHQEQWQATWKCFEIWMVCMDFNQSSGQCEQMAPLLLDKTQTHDLFFKVTPTVSSDVDQVLQRKTVFGTPPHPEEHVDDNLEVTSQVYSPRFLSLRDTVLYTQETAQGWQEIDQQQFIHGDGQEYATGWLQEGDGAVMEGLEHVIQLIDEDEDVYGQISDEYQGFDGVDDTDVARQSLLSVFDEQCASGRYQQENYYKHNGLYLSCGAKVVSLLRTWFISRIRDGLDDSVSDDAREEILEQLDSEEQLDTYEQIHNEFGSCLTDLADMGGLQFGLAMNLDADPLIEGIPWSEEVAFAVDQIPNYLDFQAPPDEGGEEEWYFKTKNTCLLGPTGAPLIPSPVTPWVVTMNLWSIDIEGGFEKVSVMDTLDETHVNPLFGHNGQSYLRKEINAIYDEVVSGETIGQLTKIEFEFSTLNIGIVPSGRLPIGDQDIILEEVDPS